MRQCRPGAQNYKLASSDSGSVPSRKPGIAGDGIVGILPGTTTATGPAKLLLGVDGGATKTLAAVLDTGTYRLSTGVAGPSNPHSVGFPSAISAISEAVGKALRSAGIEPSAISAAVLGVASVDTDEDRRSLRVSRRSRLTLRAKSTLGCSPPSPITKMSSITIHIMLARTRCWHPSPTSSRPVASNRHRAAASSSSPLVW